MSLSAAFKFPDEIKRAVKGLDNQTRLDILECIIGYESVSYSKLMKMLKLNDDKKGILNFHLKILSEGALIDRYEDWRKGNEERSFYKLSTFGTDLIESLMSSFEPKKESPGKVKKSQLKAKIWVASEYEELNKKMLISQRKIQELLEQWAEVTPDKKIAKELTAPASSAISGSP